MNRNAFLSHISLLYLHYPCLWGTFCSQGLSLLEMFLTFLGGIYLKGLKVHNVYIDSAVLVD